jgi:hypothetical protein
VLQQVSGDSGRGVLVLKRCGQHSKTAFPTEVHEVENAGRKTTPLYDRCVEGTDEVMAFVYWVEQQFPGFRRAGLLAS